MNTLSIEERRRLLLTAPVNSRLALEYPALLRTGQRIIHNGLDLLTRLCDTRPVCPDSGSGQSLSIIPLIKPVGDDCNLRCRYCDTHNARPAGERMSFSLLERIIQEILPRSPLRVDFIFHGGEPLMAGIDFFRTALALQKKYARQGQVVRNHVQTNATLITREWADFLADSDFFVGVSLDGPETAHDSCRVGQDGKGSYARVLKGVALLLDACAKIQAIALVQPAPLLSATELLSFMQGTGIPEWRINHCRSTACIATYPDYIRDLFQGWMKIADPCEISIIFETIEGLLGYPPHTCWMNGSCSKFIGFEPDGTVSPCCQMPVAPEYIYGNCDEQSIIDLMAGPRVQQFHDLLIRGRVDCLDCMWRHVCGGGCAFTRIQISGSPGEPDPLCRLYQGIFARLSQSLDTVLIENTKAATGSKHI